MQRITLLSDEAYNLQWLQHFQSTYLQANLTDSIQSYAPINGFICTELED